MVLALNAYSVALALHIMAVVAAFGLPLAYPVLVPYVRRAHPEALAGVHDTQLRLNRIVTGPGMLLILIFGAYMASKQDLWSKVWVTVPLLILIVIGGIGGAVISPALKRLSELAARGTGPEYEAVYRRYMTAEIGLAVLVLVAIFFMAAKP
jgi:uncharacterized membrane protein